jgi:hypothetical protein
MKPEEPTGLPLTPELEDLWRWSTGEEADSSDSSDDEPSEEEEK